MGHPVTLFTGQWADLTLEEVARKARTFGYNGLELACWGDHFNVTQALKKAYCDDRQALLVQHGLRTWAIPPTSPTRAWTTSGSRTGSPTAFITST